MTDREKVIKSLKWFRDKDSWREGIMIHDDHAAVRKQICDNAITLLKEQDAELSYRKAKAITHNATKLDDLTCPSCGNVIGRVRYDYCHYCGQKLDWKGCEVE